MDKTIALIKKDPRCKICLLADAHNDLFTELHHKYVVKAIASKPLAQWLNVQIDKRNHAESDPAKQLQLINFPSIQNHFKKHVPVEVAMNATLNTELMGQKQMGTFSPEVEHSIASMEADAQKANLSDFQRLQNLVTRFEEKFHEIDDTCTDLSLLTLPVYGKVVQQLTKMLETSIKLRNADKLVTALLTRAMDTFSMGALQMLMRGIETIVHEYRGDFKDPQTADAIAYKLRDLVGFAMTQNAKSALDEVQRNVRVS